MAKKQTKGLGNVTASPKCKFKKRDKVTMLDPYIVEGVVTTTEYSKVTCEWYICIKDKIGNEYIGNENNFKKK